MADWTGEDWTCLLFLLTLGVVKYILRIALRVVYMRQETLCETGRSGGNMRRYHLAQAHCCLHLRWPCVVQNTSTECILCSRHTVFTHRVLKQLSALGRFHTVSGSSVFLIDEETEVCTGSDLLCLL
jgi:hypothetical protein